MTFTEKPPQPLNPLRVLVLAGGWTDEKEVSKAGGDNVCKALHTLGHNVQLYDPPRCAITLTQGIVNSFQEQGPEVIFNVLHGPEGEDGTLQSLFQLLDLPHTFSGRLASSLAMDKRISRLLAHTANVACPEGCVMPLKDYIEKGWLHFPHVIKPCDEGSSFGVIYVDNPTLKRDKLFDTWHFGETLLVENYIPGREIQVAVGGHGNEAKVWGSVEITYKGPIFDYTPKYTPGAAQHLIPAPVPDSVRQQLHTSALSMHRLLGCRGTTRTDFRYNPDAPADSQIFFLELNTQPGFTEISLVPEIAQHNGWSYGDVLTFLLRDALIAAGKTPTQQARCAS